MSFKRYLYLSCAVALIVAAALVPSTSAGQSGRLDKEPPSETPVAPSNANWSAKPGAQAGDNVALGSSQLTAPPRGQEAAIIVELEGGHEAHFIRTTASGEVQTYSTSSAGHTTSDGSLGKRRLGRATTESGQCQNSGYGTYGWTQPNPTSFVVSTLDKPSYMGAQASIDAMVAAALNMQQVDNNCGYGDVNQLSTNYTTSSTAQPAGYVSGGVNTCRATDGSQVFGWGTGAAGSLGFACIRIHGATGAREVDLTLNKGSYNWTANSGSCPGSGNYFQTESVMTHEYGHFLGLVDMYPGNGELTMGAGISCDYGLSNANASNTLAKGDILGVAALY